MHRQHICVVADAGSLVNASFTGNAKTHCVCDALAASECWTAYGEVDPEQDSVAVLLGSDVPQTLGGADVDAPSYDDASQHEDNGVGNVL